MNLDNRDCDITNIDEWISIGLCYYSKIGKLKQQ